MNRTQAAGLLMAAVIVLTPAGLARTKKAKRSEATVSVSNPPQYSAFAHALADDARALHVLERLTFGPRESDVQAIHRAGIEPWLDEQLHPERIPEPTMLADKLEPFDSVRMSIHDTWVHYPQPRLVAAVARGLAPLPDDPELRTVVQHLVDRYLHKRAANPGDQAMAEQAKSAAADDDSDLDLKVPLSSILNAHEIDALQHGKPEDKRRVLATIPANRALDFAYALHQGQRKQLLALSPPALQRKLLLTTAPPQVVLQDMSSAKILRAVYSSRQLQEELVDFWFNHFNVYFDKGSDRFMLPTYEREAIRPYVFGKFHDLLLATAKSPAMLFYLDNAESVGPDFGARSANMNPNRPKRGLNENYGRELMELHTLGVNGGYTQKDVVEVARCFTGWTVSPPRKGSTFEFNERMHDKGAKVVLGHEIPAGGGMDDGLKVLDILAHAPQTAHHIALQLAQRFVADDPPPSLVNRMAATFTRTDGDLREVVRTMVLSPEFFSQGAYHAKVKTPFEMVVSAVRAANAEVDTPIALTQQISQLGEPLYRKIEPTGYSSANAEWVSSASLLSRMNFALALANNHVPGVRVDEAAWSRLTKTNPVHLAKALLIGNPEPQTLKAIEKALQNQDVRDQLKQSARLDTLRTPNLVAGLVIGSPEFQRR